MSATVEVLQQLIRNACVSRVLAPGVTQGDEILNNDVLRAVLEGPGIDVEVVEPRGGRPALVARVEGRDRDAPSLCLLAHTDVVPAAGEEWSRDPFGGELVDGEVWGRGAVDMLDQAAAMAVAVARLARSGFRPRGTLVLAAVPDEECGGRHGVQPLVEQYPELVRTDYALTEVGGAVRSTPGGPRIDAYVAEKGSAALVVTVRGRSGHSSRPFGTDNGLLRAARVLERLAAYRPDVQLPREWRGWVAAQGLPPEVAASLLDAGALRDLTGLDPGLAELAHASTRATVAATVLGGADQLNTIPGTVHVGVHVRVLPDQDLEEQVDDVRQWLRDLVPPEDVTVLGDAIPPTRSPVDTPLWPVLRSAAEEAHPGGRLVPALLPAQTDARWLRPLGVVVYGFGVLSDRIAPADYWRRFHGADERVDVESLALSDAAWERVCRAFLG